MKKVLLIFPRPISELPQSFAYLNSVFKSKGFVVKALVNTFNYYLTDEDILREVVNFRPSVVGFNLGTLQLLSTYTLIQKIKALGYLVIAGGPHATTCPDEVLENGVDIVVRNEGELTVAELCDNNFVNLELIAGISYKKQDGTIQHNPKRPYADFSILPKPSFDCFDVEKFITSEGVVKGLHRVYCSRGCIGLCEYCDSAIFGHKMRYKPLDDVIEEIKFRNKEYGMTSFTIADDTFTHDKEYVRQFCKRLKEENLNIIWNCSTRATSLNEELLKIMKDAGCYLIAFGIESGDAESLKIMRKGITVEQSSKAVELVAKYGLRIFANFMAGFPWEDVSHIKNTTEFIKKHFNDVYVYQVSGCLVPYPGTGIYESYKEHLGKWWLHPDFQNFGQQIHQNSTEPYKVNTYYQRVLYDDTYIWEEKFFKYSKEYKKAVKEMAFLIGRRNLINDYPNKFKRFVVYQLCKLSRFVYELNTNIEKKVIGTIMGILKHKSLFHDRMPLGAVPNKEKIK
jgi:anaerobic magnesium-protoporphyrin IX monomethyl ester cyclase